MEVVFRLAALLSGPLEDILLRRGIRPESIDEIRAIIDENGTPFSAEDMARDIFTPQYAKSPPFRVTRYSDGYMPVYYSAIEERTCVAELRHHLRDSLGLSRYFAMIACEFRGQVLILLGHETRFGDLISATDSGYPFCQKLAREARGVVDGLHAPSAREKGGTCVPVFRREALFDFRITYRCRFVKQSSGEIDFERL